jgi:DNA-directed RNA polymerase subunit F
VSARRVRKIEDITNAQALKILRDLAAIRQLSEDQRKTLGYLEKVTKRNPEEAEELVRKLVDKFGFAKITAIQLVNLSISSASELRLLLSYLERREHSDSELKEIFESLVRG